MNTPTTPCVQCGQPTREADGICHRHKMHADRVTASEPRFAPPSAPAAPPTEGDDRRYAEMVRDARGHKVTLMLAGSGVKVARTQVRTENMSAESLDWIAANQRAYWATRDGKGVARVQALHSTTETATERDSLDTAVAHVAAVLGAAVDDPAQWTPTGGQRRNAPVRRYADPSIMHPAPVQVAPPAVANGDPNAVLRDVITEQSTVIAELRAEIAALR